MADLIVVSEPERSIGTTNDAAQVSHVQRAASVIEVSVGREGIECNSAIGGDASNDGVACGEPGCAIAVNGFLFPPAFAGGERRLLLARCNFIPAGSL